MINDCNTSAAGYKDNNGIAPMSLDEYNSTMETPYFMYSSRTTADIRRSEESIKNGNAYRQNDDESIDDFSERISCINYSDYQNCTKGLLELYKRVTRIVQKGYSNYTKGLSELHEWVIRIA